MFFRPKRLILAELSDFTGGHGKAGMEQKYFRGQSGNNEG